MSDYQPGADWWQASDGKWYPPEQHPDRSSSVAQNPPAQWGAPQPVGSSSPPPGMPAHMTIEPRRKFSLLLIVLLVLAIPAVLGIFAGVVVFATGGLRDQASDSDQTTADIAQTCDVELRTVRLAMQAYVIDVGVPPASDDELVTAGFLNRASTYYDIAPGPVVVLQPGSPCPDPGS